MSENNTVKLEDLLGLVRKAFIPEDRALEEPVFHMAGEKCIAVKLADETLPLLVLRIRKYVRPGRKTDASVRFTPHALQSFLEDAFILDVNALHELKELAERSIAVILPDHVLRELYVKAMHALQAAAEGINARAGAAAGTDEIRADPLLDHLLAVCAGQRGCLSVLAALHGTGMKKKGETL